MTTARSPIVYLHGMPGGPAELSLFGEPSGTPVFAPDRATIAISADPYAAIAQAITDRFLDERVRIVAFSLGALPAVELASRLGERVTSLNLISPAAPLMRDDRDMAGWPVFMAARHLPMLFRGITRAQSLMARRAPSLLYAALFKKARGADLELSRQPGFREAMIAILVHCFASDTRHYAAEISRYVTPWSGILSGVTQPVTLWHGTEDNWAPIGMSERLATLLPNVSAFQPLQGMSHYSTLEMALRSITNSVALDGEKV